MATETSSRAGRILGRIGEAWNELDEAKQRRFETRVGLLTPSRPRSWDAGKLAVEESREHYQHRIWDEFTC